MYDFHKFLYICVSTTLYFYIQVSLLSLCTLASHWLYEMLCNQQELLLIDTKFEFMFYTMKKIKDKNHSTEYLHLLFA